MKLTNKQMDDYFQRLNTISEKTKGRLGYAIARNLRKLSEELVEYQNLKDKAITKYGIVEDGVSRIQVGSVEYEKFLEDMKEFMDIQHDVQIFFVSEDEVINSDLNGKEMLAIDFMVKKEDADE